MILGIIVILLTFLIMEGLTWLIHRYVMHGFMWFLHEDHHKRNKDSKYEKNDLFFFIFALPSILMIYYGYAAGEGSIIFYIGIGVAIYGIAYLFVHDIFIHQRIKLFRNTDNNYLLGMRRAHKMHHKHLEKDEGEAFGFLWVPLKYRKD